MERQRNEVMQKRTRKKKEQKNQQQQQKWRESEHVQASWRGVHEEEGGSKRGNKEGTKIQKEKASKPRGVVFCVLIIYSFGTNNKANTMHEAKRMAEERMAKDN